MGRCGLFLVLILVAGVALCGCTSSSSSKSSERTAIEENNTSLTTENVDHEAKNTTPADDMENMSFADAMKIIQERMDNQPPINMAIGSTTDIYLRENPTTGYSWNATVTSGLAIVNDSYVPPDNSLLGAGGEHHWTIKGTSEGNQTFSAVYRRPWEEPSPDDITYVEKFIVTP